MTQHSPSAFGITVLPEYIQSEGAARVLDNLVDRLGATSVTTSPYVAFETPHGIGSREPPPDADAGNVRLLDRPLWGKDEVWMDAVPSFVPTPSFYENTPYAPGTATELTRTEGPVVGAFLDKARDRGLKTCLQVMAAIPPAYRVQFGDPLPGDEPMLPDGRIVPTRVDRNASLGAAGVRVYMRGLIRDMCTHYPQCDVIRFDWPEYPPYDFDSLFADYNPQVAPYAAQIGIDLERLAREMQRLCPDPGFLEAIVSGQPFPEALDELCARVPAVADHFRLRHHLTESFARFLCDTVAEASGGRTKVLLPGFPPPWNRLSGFDPAALVRFADDIAMKFYTMHWPMMGANYVEKLCFRTGVSAADAARYFRTEFMGQTAEVPLAYPDPETPHGVTADAIRAKMALARESGVDIIAAAHAYGPIDDVVQRLRALLDAPGRRIEMNRYAYLSDAKMEAVGAVTRPR